MTRRRISIAVIVVAVLVTVVTVILGSFAALVYRHEAESHREQLRRELVSVSNQMAVALSLPMWNIDTPQLKSIVEGGMSARNIAAIEAITPDQRHVLTRDERWKAIEAPAAPGIDGLIVEQRQVMHAGESIGEVRIYGSSRFVDESLAEWRQSALLLILLLDVGLVLSLSCLLWALLLRPVKALEQFAAAVKRGESPPPPSQVLFAGELGALRESISDMIEILDIRYRALRDSEERLKLATRSGSIGVWDWDIVHDEIVWDDQVRCFYGFPEGDYKGRIVRWFEMLVPDDRQRGKELLDAALTSEQALDIEFTIQRADGSTRIIKGMAATTRDASGRPVRMAGVNLDVTEQRIAEQEIRALNADLENRVEQRTAQLVTALDEIGRARDLAESATRAKSEFLANMSHEIRTPMNAVLGMTELALRGELAPKQRGYLKNAKSAAESLLNVLNDILDFSKIEAGKLQMERRTFTLKDALQKVATVVGLRAQDKGLQLAFGVSPGVPPLLVGDPLRLEQVLVNLCTNAVKFTERGDVSVTVETVTAVHDGRMLLCFRVADTGIGMKPEQVASLFQPFNQLDASTTRKYGGTGLGLVICKRLVALMGGEIAASSEPGRGSEFHFTATFEIGDAISALERPESTETRDLDQVKQFAALRGRHVLLVEDNEMNQIVASELLSEACGMQVTVAASGPEALARLNGAAFDVVLMDVQMPEMDGYEVTRRIRSTPALAGLPIIAMTAHAMDRDREMCAAVGMNGFVSKPFDPQDLFGALAKWLQIDPAATSVTATEEEVIDGVSVELGLRRCLGKADLYEKIVRRYVASRAQTPDEIQDALRTGDRTTATRIAHTLISTAGIVGAMGLSNIARALQKAIESDDDERSSRLLALLAKEHAAVSADLRSYLAAL